MTHDGLLLERAGPPRIVLIAWALGLLPSFVLGIGPFRKAFVDVGRRIADGSPIHLEVAIGLSAVAALAAAALVCQGGAIAAGYLVHGLVRARASSGAVRAPGTPGEDLAVAWLWGLHTFPVCALYLPSLPLLRRVRHGLRRRRPRVAAAMRAIYYGWVAVFLTGLYCWAPFFTDGERAALAGFTLALAVALRFAPGRRQATLLVASAVLGLGFALAPPQLAPSAMRYGTALAAAAFGMVPALLAGRDGTERLGVAGPTIGMALLAAWVFWGEFLVFPSPHERTRVEASPGVRVEYLNGNGGAWTDNRFLTEACVPGRLPMGAERSSTASSSSSAGVRRVASGSTPATTSSSTARAGSGTSAATPKSASSASTSRRSSSWSRSRTSRSPRRPCCSCPPSGERLYAIDDDDGTFHRIDLARGTKDAGVRECLPNGLFVDETLARVYLPSCGILEIYDVADLDAGRDGTRPWAEVDLRRYPTPPFPLGAKFHRIDGDPLAGKAYATYMETGRVYRVDGRTGTLEHEAIVGRGIRDITWDAVNGVLWVGNYVTGDLLAIAPDTLAVVGKVRVGRRIRSIEPSLDARRVFVTSAIGGISVDVATILGRPATVQ